MGIPPTGTAEETGVGGSYRTVAYPIAVPAANSHQRKSGIIDRCTINVASSVWHCLRLNRCSIGSQPPQSPAVRKCDTTRTILGVCSDEIAQCFGTAGNRGKRIRQGGVDAVPSRATRSLAATVLMQWSLRLTMGDGRRLHSQRSCGAIVYRRLECESCYGRPLCITVTR